MPVRRDSGFEGEARSEREARARGGGQGSRGRSGFEGEPRVRGGGRGLSG